MLEWRQRVLGQQFELGSDPTCGIGVRELALAPHAHAFPDFVLPIATPLPHDRDSAASGLRTVALHRQVVATWRSSLATASRNLTALTRYSSNCVSLIGLRRSGFTSSSRRSPNRSS